MKEPLLILMRHGQSLWNLHNIFTGWVDVPLSEKGIQEAIEGGKMIADIPIDICFTSALIRAQMTAMLALNQHLSKKIPILMPREDDKLAEWTKIYSPSTQAECIPVYASWHLNERMYGELQGCNKAETAEKFGQSQVQIWRRSYDIAPPKGESLKMTAERTLPYFQQEIVPHLEKGQNVFIAAHGNSLRSIVMALEGLSQEEVLALEIPTGIPIFYSLSKGKYLRFQEPPHALRSLSR